MALEYTFTKEVNLSQLEDELHSSEIEVKVEKVSTRNMDIIISFYNDLSDSDVEILNSIVENHNPDKQPLPDLVRLDHATTPENSLYTYPTTLPPGWYVSFQGAGDTATEIGMGTKMIFHLTSRDEKMVRDAVFNQDVYVKDGYFISKDAPFGASVDIEAVHPYYGTMLQFSKSTPIYGTWGVELDTDGRAFLPKGMILRVTVNNAQGSVENPYEESPSNFFLAGRFELFREKPPGA